MDRPKSSCPCSGCKRRKRASDCSRNAARPSSTGERGRCAARSRHSMYTSRAPGEVAHPPPRCSRSRGRLRGVARGAWRSEPRPSLSRARSPSSLPSTRGYAPRGRPCMAGTCIPMCSEPRYRAREGAAVDSRAGASAVRQPAYAPGRHPIGLSWRLSTLSAIGLAARAALRLRAPDERGHGRSPTVCTMHIGNVASGSQCACRD